MNPSALVVRRSSIAGYAEPIGGECKAQIRAIAGAIARICNTGKPFSCALQSPLSGRQNPQIEL